MDIKKVIKAAEAVGRDLEKQERKHLTLEELEERDDKEYGR